jgi:CBS domain-containing protein
MTSDPVSVRADAPFKEVAARLREKHAAAFPVLDADDKVIGVVSEVDLLPKEALEAGREGHRGWLASAIHRGEREKSLGVTASAPVRPDRRGHPLADPQQDHLG